MNNFTQHNLLYFSISIITLILFSPFYVFAQHDHHTTETGNQGAFVGLDDSHVPIDTSLLYSCDGCVINPATQTLTIFKFRHDDLPFLTGGATYLITPNPYAFTTFADDLPPQLFGPNLVITDNDPLDADPTLGVLELTGVNGGVYSVWEIFGPPGLLRNNLPQSSSEVTSTSYPHTGITNILLETSQTNIPQLMIPRTIPQTNLNTMNSFGATINGNPLVSGDQMPGSFIVSKHNKYSGNPPPSILFSNHADPNWSTAQRFSNLGIPKYVGPTNMEEGNMAVIPPVFIAPNPTGGNFIMSPRFDQLSIGTNLVLRLDGVHQFESNQNGHSHGGSSIRGITMPLAIGGSDVGVSMSLRQTTPNNVPALEPTEVTTALYLDVSSVGDIDFSDQATFSENPFIDFYLDKNDDGSCPTNVIVYLLHNAGTPSAHWHPVEVGGHSHGPIQDSSSDTSTSCAYSQELEHFSSYLIGMGGSGSGGHDHGGGGGRSHGGHSHGSTTTGHSHEAEDQSAGSTESGILEFGRPDGDEQLQFGGRQGQLIDQTSKELDAGGIIKEDFLKFGHRLNYATLTVLGTADDLGYDFGNVFDGQKLIAEINNSKFPIKYKVDGSIQRIQIDEDSSSIVFFLTDVKQSEMLIRLPRDLIDAEENKFILLTEASPETETSYEIIESTDKFFTLKLTVTDNTKTLTIVGTKVVPEFGIYSLVVMVLSLILVIIFAKQQRFSTLTKPP
jgi:predicted secreted protein with PEFG-CTERM motif